MPETGGELSFKEMCSRFDVTPRTLRYYEYIELLSPRKDGRARFYGGREVARMTLILRGRRFGFSLEQIRQWLEMYESHGTREQFATFIEQAEKQLQAIEGQIAELAAARDDLAALRDEAARLREQMPERPARH
ncbi:MerR family DNA-binding protein [Paracoccus sp. S-4012]|uniref:MerR family transcriptional regulator n=1 Tax=Paracoccus sp. S-4012 TaxID=2665648 RepID=UPI0012B01BF6|nr:MerR family DNA-binding transcriptional regulator [Paracoccus sp. S-4012]MRX49533.1 MerR family DNA-binding protein [Paracoccus sp. S-4012]